MITRSAIITCKKCDMPKGAIIHLTAKECGKGCQAPEDHHKFNPVESALERLEEIDYDCYKIISRCEAARKFLASIPA